jgi:hypothetical protein
VFTLWCGIAVTYPAVNEVTWKERANSCKTMRQRRREILGGHTRPTGYYGNSMHGHYPGLEQVS